MNSKFVKSKPGFSLLELTIVIALCAVLATLVAGSGNFLQRMMVRAEVEKIYTISRYLQQKAMATNTIITLAFDPSNNSYTYGNTHEKLPAQVKFGALDGALGPPSAPTKTIGSPVTFTSSTIEFHPTGSIKSGTVYLVDRGESYMCALSYPVSHVSFIRTYEHAGTWKLLG